MMCFFPFDIILSSLARRRYFHASGWYPDVKCFCSAECWLENGFTCGRTVLPPSILRDEIKSPHSYVRAQNNENMEPCNAFYHAESNYRLLRCIASSGEKLSEVTRACLRLKSPNMTESQEWETHW